MPRHPLLPILRVGFALSLGALLLYRRREPPHPPPDPGAVWVTDVDGSAPGVLRIGAQATGPLKGQKTPPCNRNVEVEVAGACWVEHTKKPPCPPGLYEGRGMCLLPVQRAERPSTSITP